MNGPIPPSNFPYLRFRKLETFYQNYKQAKLNMKLNLQITEEELQGKEIISPEDVLRLNKITENYLCPTEANTFGIDFTR